MSIGLRQEIRQSQQLVMTQQLQQSIKLLQLSAAELNEFVEQEIEKNPLLSREDGAGEFETQGDAPVEAEQDSAPAESESAEDFVAGESLDTGDVGDDWSGAVDEGGYTGREPQGQGGGFDSEDERSLEQTLSVRPSLSEHLREQLQADIHDPALRLIGAQLIEMLDEAGYLREDTASLVAMMGAEPEQIEQAIAQLQRFDPPGVFARDLKECLRIQLEEKGRVDGPMEQFLAHMEMLAEGDMAGLRKACGVDDEELYLILADVRGCNPRPASAFAQDSADAVIPDVLIRRGKQGWMIELNPDALPRVLVNTRYATELSAHGRDKEAKRYVSEQLASASWLVKALNQRAETILKVSREIVKQQEKFFLHGIRFLKPLVLRDIAEAVEMHESTISRVTTAKFMATPRGTFEMKYFFTSGVSGAVGGGEFSSKTVMHYIRELVEAEEASNILSDDAIVTLLKDKNIDIARRTVTKYREAMHIPSSVVRRRQKQRR